MPDRASSAPGSLAGEPRERRPEDRPRTSALVGAWLTWWVVLMSFWIMLDDSLATDELLAGAGAAGYNATVLHGAHLTHPVALYAEEPAGATLSALLGGAGSAAGALVLAWLALYWRRLPVLRGWRPSPRAAAVARGFQSGVINDYVTWLVLGLACLGGVLTLIVG